MKNILAGQLVKWLLLIILVLKVREWLFTAHHHRSIDKILGAKASFQTIHAFHVYSLSVTPVGVRTTCIILCNFLSYNGYPLGCDAVM